MAEERVFDSEAAARLARPRAHDAASPASADTPPASAGTPPSAAPPHAPAHDAASPASAGTPPSAAPPHAPGHDAASPTSAGTPPSLALPVPVPVADLPLWAGPPPDGPGDGPWDNGLPEDTELFTRDFEDLGLVDPMSLEEPLGQPSDEEAAAGELKDLEWLESTLAANLPPVELSRICAVPGDPARRAGIRTGGSALPLGPFDPDVPRLDDPAQLLEDLEALETQQACLDAHRISLLAGHADLVGRYPGISTSDVPGVAASEVAATLRIAQRTARGMVEEAMALADPRMSPVLETMRAGQLTRRRAAVVLDASIPVPVSRLREFAEAAVQIAAPADGGVRPTAPTLSRRLRRLAEDYADEPIAIRRAKAVADRRVDVVPVGDGMCWLNAFLPLETGAAIDTRLTAIARSLQSPAEERTVNQLRADVLADLVLSVHAAPHEAGAQSTAPIGTDVQITTCPGLKPAPPRTGDLQPAPLPEAAASDGRVPGTAPSLPGATGQVPPGCGPLGGVRMELVVTVPAATLAGGGGAGEILGYGPIDPESARRLAAQASTWTRLVVSPETGAPLAVGRVRYTPTAAMRRFLAVRDGTCRFPGCDKPAAATEADHTKEWADGGSTEIGNLALLCPEHHRLKSLGLWKVRHAAPPPAPPPAGPAPRMSASPAQAPNPPPGTLEWTSPSGRRFLTYPHADPPPPF
ncbi:HNH endonuclease signature motif containing protein [Sinomonas halotolerans]|uniref:DUF222 domain-containing protein n=1 Tax=Sinomonas halotolerans TaxID=1644133 RepID=A0ABU9WZE1_9MICC